MAFTTEEQLSIAKVLGTTPTLLDAHLTSLGATLTTEVEDAVRDELTRWETSGAKFTKIHPKERNYGVETFPDALKNDIRKNIAMLLEYTVTAYAAAGMGTLQIGI